MTNEEQKEHYEKKYSNYKALPYFMHEYRKFFYRFKNVLSDLGIDTKKYNRMIDLGSAFGVKTYIMADFFTYAKGVDFIQNSISVSNLLNDKPNLEFQVQDVDHTILEDERFSFISALGLSVFNKKQISEIISNIEKVIHQYAEHSFVLLIGSETDFSGKAPSGWHYHTRSEINQLVGHFNSIGYKAQLYFPHKKLNNYKGRGLIYALTELFKLLSSSKREYFIVIEKV